MIILYIILFILYSVHIHVSCVLFFYFIAPENEWFKDNYFELCHIYAKIRKWWKNENR